MTELDRILKSERLLEDLARSIRHILLARCRGLSAAEREDVEQEVKLKLCRSVAGGKKIAHLKSYLWKAVMTTALDVLDQRDKTLPLDGVPNETEGDNGREIRGGELKLWLGKTAEGLSPARKAVMSLYLKGLSLDRISRELGWSEPKVRHLFYRGLNDMKMSVGGKQRSGAGRIALVTDKEYE
jgi:RNA polymerase sigma factor (sigma-70 family)